MLSCTQVGRPWLHCPARSVASMSRSSASISATVSRILARTAPWQASDDSMLVMVAVAGLAAVRRTRRRYPGVWLDALLSIAVSALVISGLALTVVVRVEPWYRPQYAIPFLGMVLGNGLTGISLGLDRLLAALADDRRRVETWLALGATWWEAALPAVREAVRTGMIPILNSMTVAGLVSLPGMMTGQLLAGVPPVQAVRYQIVILFVIAAATALGTVTVVLLGARRLFDRDHRFRAAAIRDLGTD